MSDSHTTKTAKSDEGTVTKNEILAAMQSNILNRSLTVPIYQKPQLM